MPLLATAVRIIKFVAVVQLATRTVMTHWGVPPPMP